MPRVQAPVSGYVAKVVRECPACHARIELRTTEVTVAPNGEAIVGRHSTDHAVMIHLRVGCPSVYRCDDEPDE